ncbi:MAG: hypothetical protein ACI9BW_003462 [Gammaproteobacteria bacterium]|jgi:uncharacterized protein (DUF1015 family)
MTKSKNDLVRPFRGLRPVDGQATEIAAPPYDVINTAEARALAKNKPHSFLHVSRAEIDLPPTTDPYADAVYAKADENLRALISQGLLVRDPEEQFYVYRMSVGSKVQTGVAVSASIEAYLQNRIRKHELTRPSKEDDRVRQIESVEAMTGPVLLIYRSDTTLANALALVTAHDADSIVPDLQGVRHELWAVRDAAQVALITERLNQMDAIYIADGHHRSAAAARVAAARRAKHSGPNLNGDFDGFLAVAFPDDEVTILDYNRLVRDLHGHTTAEFIDQLTKHFNVLPMNETVRPQKPLSFGMYLDHQWYGIDTKAPPRSDDPVERLDVRVLDRLVLEPLLGITDPRTDSRIDFVGGSRGPEALAERVDSGEMAIGFMLFPTSLHDLMAVADAGKIMPPKSTWFEPKLADGLISQPLD